MYLGAMGEKPVIHCSECKNPIDGLYWTIADKPESYEDKDGKKHVIDDEFITVKTLCDRDFVRHIAQEIRRTTDLSFNMGVRQMYTHIYGPAGWYNKDKMRVLLNAIGMVIEEEELKKEQEKKDGEV